MFHGEGPTFASCGFPQFAACSPANIAPPDRLSGPRDSPVTLRRRISPGLPKAAFRSPRRRRPSDCGVRPPGGASFVVIREYLLIKILESAKGILVLCPSEFPQKPGFQARFPAAGRTTSGLFSRGPLHSIQPAAIRTYRKPSPYLYIDSIPQIYPHCKPL